MVGRDPPDCWLLIEWAADAEAPTDYWLSNLPDDTPIADLVRLAKIRWRIEHDYRELRGGCLYVFRQARRGGLGS